MSDFPGLAFLRTHPFPVQAHFERSLVLTFAYPIAQVRPLLPAYLTPDSWLDKWAFVAVALVQTRALRPKGFPAAFGHDFFLAGYRIFARYVTAGGRRLRGLYILRSQTDKRRMTLLGNLFTHYGYQTVPVALQTHGSHLHYAFGESAVAVQVPAAGEETALPPASPFATWKEARRFAGPLPFTFAYHAPARAVVLVEGVRPHWTPAPVHVSSYRLPLLAELGLGTGGVLASAFVVNDIPYTWKKGSLDPWPR